MPHVQAGEHSLGIDAGGSLALGAVIMQNQPAKAVRGGIMIEERLWPKSRLALRGIDSSSYKNSSMIN